MATLGVLDRSGSGLVLPTRGVRAGRLADLLRPLGVADHEVWRHPALVAAALAFLQRVPRVVIAGEEGALAEVDAIALVGSRPEADESVVISERGADEAKADEGLEAGPPRFSELPPGAAVVSVAAARRRREYLAAPGGAVLVPGHARMVPVGGGALAAVLYLMGGVLGPSAEVHTLAACVAEREALVEAGLVLLGPIGPSRRVGALANLPPRPRPRVPEVAPEAPTHPELAGLEAKLRALTQASAHKLTRGPGALATVKREAERVLQAEVAAGVIKGYALIVSPAGDDDQDVALEVIATLPKRVGQVILRINAR